MAGTLTQIDAVTGLSATTTNVLIPDGTGVICHQSVAFVVKVANITGTWTVELFYVYSDGTKQRIGVATALTANGVATFTLDAPFGTAGPVPTATTIKYTKVLGVSPNLDAEVFAFYGD